MTFNPKKYIAVDTETTGIDVWGKDLPFAVAMCDENGETVYFEWPVNPFTRGVDLIHKDIVFLKKYISNPKFIKIFHNSKFDVRMLSKIGIDTIGEFHDTLFMARVCFTLEYTYGLKDLSKKYLEISNDDEKELQQSVISARRKLSSYNTLAIKTGERLIIKHESPWGDYWLPKFFDNNNMLCGKYCRLDTYRTMGLFLFYQDIMNEDSILENTYKFEMELWPIVFEMEQRGLRVFPDALKKEAAICRKAKYTHLKNMQRMVEELKLCPFSDDKMEQPYTKTGRLVKNWEQPEFNPGSSQQLMRILYLPENKGGLGLEPEHRNKKTKKLCTDKDTLDELMYSPFVQELSAYRGASQALSLFFNKFHEFLKPDPLYPNKVIIQPGLNQCGTKTGRFSCTNPNLQQLSDPEKSLSASYNVRKCFGPRDGYIWIRADFSQQEVRIFASIGEIPFILNAIKQGGKVFEVMANQAWGGENNPKSFRAYMQAADLYRSPTNDKVRKYWERIGWSVDKAHKNKPQSEYVQILTQDWLREFNYDIIAAEKSLDKGGSRQRMKNITYSNIYGGGPAAYAGLLKCTLEEAKDFGSEYHNLIPEIRPFMKMMERKAEIDGYIITLYNRKLRVERGYAYRSVNYLVQGSAADMMKDSIVKLDSFLWSTGLDAHVIMTIHDEIIIECKAKQVNTGLLRAIKTRMEDSGNRLIVPTPVEISIDRKQWNIDSEQVVL